MPAAFACPHCGHTVPAYDWRHDAQLRAAGQCLDCRVQLAAGARYRRCGACRVKRAAAMRRKRGRAHV